MFLFFTVFRWLRRLIYLAVVAAFVFLVVTSVQVATASRVSRSPDAVPVESAIVVLAAPPGAASGDLGARCSQAALLYHARRSHRVIVLAAAGGTGTASAGPMVQCLRRDAVPGGDISLVPSAGLPSQLEQVATSASRVVVVADPLETKWVLGVAAGDDLDAVVSPAPVKKGGFWSTIGTLWGQTLRVAAGRIVGFSHTGWA